MIHRFMLGLARALAITGGAVLGLLILMTCLSVLGREIAALLASDAVRAIAPGLADLPIGPVPGDFEIVEAGVAFAIFAFLPLCQITGGHATVDIFTNKLPPRAVAWLRAVTEIAFAAVLVLIAWRLAIGTLDKRAYGETTFFLQFPVWWAYGASLVAALAAALVGLYTAAARVLEAWRGAIILPDGAEAEH